MEKNGLFTIDQQTIKSIIDPILTGTDLTDICGKYGISLFKDYHKGNDGTINVKTICRLLGKSAYRWEKLYTGDNRLLCLFFRNSLCE